MASWKRFALWKWFVLVGTSAGVGAAGAVSARAAGPVPDYRVEIRGFDAGESDVRAVLDSAARELWRFFPDYQIDPIVVTRGHEGPITLFGRNGRGEIVMRLDTGGLYWCQYAYQFAHELCHVLCAFGEDQPGNKWFEETLCETASLFVLRAMARTWKEESPYPNWRDFRDALRSYADDVLRSRDRVGEIYERGLPAFYRTHEQTLREHPCRRDLNGAMSVVLLHLFEEEPNRWEAIRWLNTGPSPEGEPFRVYLGRWHRAVPERHKAFVERIAKLYGVELPSGDAGDVAGADAAGADAAGDRDVADASGGEGAAPDRAAGAAALPGAASGKGP